MIGLQDPRLAVERFLDREIRPEFPDVVLVSEQPIEYEAGYVFGWQSKAALEGSLSDTIVPATPIWVDRITGEARFASTVEQGLRDPHP